MPPHSLHLFLIVLPEPLHDGHVSWLWTVPNNDCLLTLTYPAPLQFEQMEISLDEAAPVPPQASYSNYLYFSLTIDRWIQRIHITFLKLVKFYKALKELTVLCVEFLLE